MNKTSYTFDKFIHSSRLRAISRRGVAALLTLIMTVGLLPADSLAAGAVWPLKAVVNVADPTVDPAVPDGTGEAPTVTIEVNGVIDESNKLTGFVEVAIRVKPAQLHLDATGKIVNSVLDPNYDHSETQPFSSLAVALEYSDKLTPWEWEKIDGNWDKLDVTVSGNETKAIDATSAIGGGFSTRKMVEIDPLHKKTRIAQAAISPKGTAGGTTTPGAGGGTATAAEGDAGDTGDSGTTTPVTPTATGGGYLYLMAEGFKAKEYNDEDTVLAVVRFKYERDKDDETKNPWSTMFPQGASNPAVTDWIDPSSPNCLVKLAPAAKVREPADPIVDWEVRYESGKSAARPNGNLFYYSTDTTDGVEAYDPSKPTTDTDYKSLTSNCMELALVDTTAATPSTTTVVPGKVNYTLVNRLSYNFSGGDPNDFATILFYDWDDTLIGTLVVKKDVDSRKRVNDYVLKNFIYTDGNNVAAGDDTNLSLQDNTDATISSLKRKDNYRGKYDWTAPGPDVTTPVVANGNDFPLSNKLDYVFFKRPMVNNEAKKPTPDGYTGGATDPQYLADLERWKVTEYIQKSDATTGKGEWDKEYPYTHGWALVEDYQHPENVWTTLGMIGELVNYTDYRTAAIPPASLTTPAELSVSGGGTLAFADFDFSEHTAPSTYAVKAIYEPGMDLLNTGTGYRMSKAPYFNKLNANPAAAIDAFSGLTVPGGGAYSAEMAFERANIDSGDNKVHGVARMRSPAIRQDTTTDLKWETNTALNINHNLTNPDLQETYVGKGQTTYTKIEVENVEEIAFSLTLSAKQHRVDYYLKEQYNANFVAGGDRTPVDTDREATGENIPDNYNYLTDESNTTDAYYDAKYLEREGSHGFVLYGTLNNLMMKATNANHGGTDFNSYVSNENMTDANLRHPVTKEPATSNSSSQRTAMRNAIKAAALQAEAHVGQPDEADYWNAEHGHAQLTYHQLQWFITDYITTGSATLMTPAAAQAQQIEWCHLDEACAAASSGKPTTWEELMQVADAGDDAKIKLLGASEIESYFALRDVGGAVWSGTAGVANFATNVINAVAAIKGMGVAVADITWDQVQYYLDQGTVGTSPAAMDQYGSDNYWWYDKSTDGAIDSWSDLDLAVKAAIAPSITLPDGRTVSNRPAKLNQLESTFNANAGDPNATQAWIDGTHNLCADGVGTAAGVGTKFTNWTTFVTEVKDAWTAADGAAVTNPTWEQVQYHVIHKSDSGYTFPAVDPAESSGYWWKDGGQKITDLKSLLNAAQKGMDSWSSFSFSDYTSATYLGFADDFKGTMYNSTSFSNFKTKIAAYVSQGNANMNGDWDEVQYFLCFNAIPNSVQKPQPVNYYWWKNGGTISAVDFSYASGADEGARADKLAAAVSDAAFRAAYNGNTAAWDELVADTANILYLGRLVGSPVSGSESDYTDNSQFTRATLSDVQTYALLALQNKVGNVGNPGPTFPAPVLTWKELQYALLNSGNYKKDVLIQNDDYWWKTADSKGAKPSEDLATLQTKIAAVAADPSDTTALQELKDWFTVDRAENMMFTANGSDPLTAAFLSSIPWETLDYGASGGDCYATGTFVIEWVQIQDMMANYYDGYAAWDLLNATDAADDWGDSGYGYTDPTQEPSWTSFSLPRRAPLRANAVKVPSEPEIESKTELSEDGQTETTTTEKQVYNEETGNYDTVVEITVVVTIPGDGFTTIVTTVTPAKLVYDEETGTSHMVPGTPKTTTETVMDETPAETVKPTETVAPTESPEATESPEPTETDNGSNNNVGADDPVGPTESPAPTESPEATESVVPTEPNDGTGDGNTDGPSSGTGDAGATFPPEGEGSEPAPTESPEPTETDDNNVGTAAFGGPEDTTKDGTPKAACPTESVDTDSKTDSGDAVTDAPSSGTSGATFPPEGEGSEQEELDNDNVGTAALGGLEPTESAEPTETTNPEDSGPRAARSTAKAACPTESIDTDSKTDSGDAVTDAPSSGASGATFPQEGEGSGQEDTDSKTNDNVVTAALGGPEDTTKDGTPKAACPTESIDTEDQTNDNVGTDPQIMTMSSPAPALPQWVQDLQGEGKELPDWAMEKVLAGEEIPAWAILLMQAGKDIPPWAAELAQNGGELPQELATLVANGEDLPEGWPAEAQSAEGESPPILEPEVDPPKPDDTGGGEDPANVGTVIPDGPEDTTKDDPLSGTEPGGMANSRTRQSSPAARQRFGPPNSEGRTDQEFPNGSNTSSGRILL